MRCDECTSHTNSIISWDGKLLCTRCFYSDIGEANPSHISDAGEWEKAIERMPKDRQKIESDGLSTSYYQLPAHATELRHLISAKGMSKSRGDIFKACYRLGEKAGTDVMYDLNKMKFFIEDLIEMHQRGEHL